MVAGSRVVWLWHWFGFSGGAEVGLGLRQLGFHCLPRVVWLLHFHWFGFWVGFGVGFGLGPLGVHYLA